MKWWNRRTVLAVLGTLGFVLLAMAAGVVYFVSSSDFEQFASDYIVNAIERRTGARVTLGGFDADFRARRFTLDGLVLRGEEPGAAPPLAEIERVAIGVRWRALINRRIDLSTLSIVRPRVRITIDDAGRTNLPAPPDAAPGAPSRFELSIGDLVVEGGALELDERRVDISFGVSGLEGEFDYAGATGVLSGRIAYAGALDREARPSIPYALDASFDYTRGTVLVEEAALRSGPTRIALQGRIDDVLSGARGGLEYTGSVALPFLNYFFTRESFEGEAEVAGRLEFSGGRFAAGGRMRSPRLVVEGWTAEAVESDYSYAFPERTIEATGLAATVAGGRVEGAADVYPIPGSAPRRVDLDVAFREVDAAALRRIYPWDPKYVVRSRATGTLAGWFEGKFERFDFEGAAALVPAAAPANPETVSLPIAGSTAYRGVPGAVEVRGASMRLGSTGIEADGRIGRASTDLGLAVESADLRDLAFLHPEANGAAEFEGRLRGRIARPDIDGGFVLAGFRYEDWEIDRAEGGVALAGDAVRFREVRVREGGSEIVVDGSYDLARRDPELDVALTRIEGALLRRATGWPVEGVISGRVRVDAIEPLTLEGRIESAELAYAGRPIGSVAARVAIDGPVVSASDVHVRRGEGAFRGDLRYNRATGEIRAALDASGQTLEEFAWLGVPEGLGGRVGQASFEIEGTRRRPRVEGTAVVEGLALGGQRLGRATVAVEDGGRSLSATLERNFSLEAEIDTGSDGLPFRANARFTDYGLERLAGAGAGTFVVTGDARFEGRLSNLAGVAGTGRITTLGGEVRGRALQVIDPFTFDFDSRRLRISRIEVSGDATSVSLGGTIGLARPAPLDFEIDGYIDLGLLGGTLPDLETGGSITIGGQVTGTLANPELRGSASLEDVSIGHQDVFLSVTSLAGGLFFDGSTINVNDVAGQAGGGTVTVRGTIALDGAAPGGFDLRLDLAGVRVRTPEGLRTVLNGALGLRGTLEAPSLEGNLEVVSLSFDQGFEEFLDLFTGGVEGSNAPGPLDDVALAIHAEGERDIRIENGLARVEGRFDLDIGGTFGNPTVTGHVEATEGTLTFQGARYRVTRANVDFVDPLGIEPLIDVQAETELRDYRIILTIAGRGDDLRLDMRSDPPLPQLEVVSLIAGGRTREELAASGAGPAPTEEQLFTGSAATILADLLQARVGSRFGLLDSVRIDPFLVGSESDPVARITISEQITRDLSVTYSQDLSSNRQQIILIEYFLNNDTSFIASRDETGSLGLDIKLRRRFR